MDATWIPQQYETVPGGFSSAVTPDLLPAGQFAWGFNTAIRGGKPHTRPPFIERMVLPDGLVQGADYFGVQGGMIVAAIAGHFYRLRIGNNIFSWEPITLPWYNSPTIPQVWMQQTIESLVIQDFQSDPIIYNGSTARRAGVDEVPRGRMMAYGNGRLWVAINNKELVAGDIRTRTPGSELKFTETNYLTGGGALYFPRGLTGLDFIPVTGAADFGTLMVFANEFAESIRADVTTRDQWGMPGFITTVFRNVGCAGDWSIVQVNQDLYWRDGGGNIRSLQNGISTNSGPGSYPISREVSRLVDYDSTELLPFCSAIHFDNRLLMTSSPYLNRLGGVSFKNIVALDFSPISTNQQKAPPAYDAQWTGIPGVVKLIQGEFNGRSRAFAVASDESGTNRLWELLESGRDDVSISCGSGTTVSTPIQSFIEYPSFDFQPGGRRKRLMRLDVWLTELIGDLELTAYWHADNTQKWFEWDAIETCAKVTDDSVANPHVWKNLLPQQRTQIKTFTIPDVVDDITKYAEQIGFEFQIRLAWRGHCQIEKIFAYAALVDDPDYANRENLVTECVENNVSGNEISYVIPTTADYMSVNVPEAFVSSGEPGGPFTPASITYRISNPGIGPINWTLALSEDWLEASALAGTLRQGEFVDVVVSLSAAADLLAPSVSPYTGLITFTNATNNCGNVVLDASLTVQIGDAPTITQHPSNLTILADGSAAFAVTAEGTPELTYRWEMSKITPVAWYPLTDGDAFAGTDTPALTLLNVPLSRNASKVRCRVRNDYGMAVSNSAALYVHALADGAGPFIVTGPADQFVYPGDPSSFNVVASGEFMSLAYQWEVSLDGGGTWGNQTDGGDFSGATTDTLTINPTLIGYGARRFRCVVTDMNGTVTSNSALLTVADPIITGQPVSVETYVSNDATFTVTAVGGTTLSYQWQKSIDGGVTWSNVGTNSASLTFDVLGLSQDGNLFRCVVTDVAGSKTSEIAELNVYEGGANPFSVAFDVPYLIGNSQNTADLTTPVGTPVFTGGEGPFFYVSGLPVTPGLFTNFLEDYGITVTMLAGILFDDVYINRVTVTYADSVGNVATVELPIGLQIMPAGVLNLGTIPFAGAGTTGADTNDEVLDVLVFDPSAVSYSFQFVGPTQPFVDAALVSVINGAELATGDFYAPIDIKFRVLGPDGAPGVYYSLATLFLISSSTPPGPGVYTYRTEIIPITITVPTPL